MTVLGRRHLAISISTTLIALASFAAQAAPPGNTASGAAGDPLLRLQWHVLNQGQAVIGDSRPVAGVDMDVDILHALGIRGKHVRIGVVDSGLEIRHEDLAANVIPNGSYNFMDGSTDPTPSGPGYDHGTQVAGIAAAVGWNGRGGRGIAPEASLAGFAFGEASSVTDAGIRYAWGDGPQSRPLDVFNFSAGNITPFYQDFPLQDQQSWDALMQSTRSGRGAIYVKSAGNSFLNLRGRDQDGNVIDACGDAARANGVGCGLANQDTLNNLFGTIVVASVNAVGKRAAYSSPGSALWISGLGGLIGYQRAFYPNAAEDLGATAAPFVYDPAIVTTDLSGCTAGSNADHDGPTENALDTSASTIDPACNYTATFNGTSAAAPTVAGVAALVLGVNPALSARDVKYILATTARQVDPWQPRAVYQGSVIDPGWITNAAGHHFSNWYGFGLADGAAAVYEATNFTPLAPLRDTQWVASTVAASKIGGPAQPAKQRMRITQAMKVEAVQLSLATTHRTPANLRVVLESPSGTRSYVMTPFSALDASAYATTGFYIDLTSSNAFLDEKAQGIWTLEVTDMTEPSTTASLQNFKLRILGH
ncbi:S8 family peptidase [Xanthomonas campestris]|uniref:S8 family peptidase n=1 Tax=Xanthomonas campestris TaxID=339 RepID=UPI000D455F1E|nr:S8 family peptidase [Xanthomonas campestris]